MKRNLFICFMILTLAVGTAGCGNHREETLSGTEAQATPEAVDTIEKMTPEETQPQTTETETAEKTSAETAETTESSKEETTKAAITEEKAEKLLIEEFGAVDEGSGDKNVFTYEKVMTVDGVDYYSYKWEAGDGTYLCNAFVKTDGTDIMTGIYADGKWELGSDLGVGDGDFDEEFDEDYAGDDEEYYDDSDDAPYDDGFEDVDSGEEEPADDN
ncbi:MAG: hypothetical protein PUG60_12160 [Lachnospiraceae bacterium]|nr:hypothetical protein [Lachnospiraceae bacterium]MDY4971250.1 hypothetical protein [Lachnospiraceae bacterium]